MRTTVKEGHSSDRFFLGGEGGGAFTVLNWC